MEISIYLSWYYYHTKSWHISIQGTMSVIRERFLLYKWFVENFDSYPVPLTRKFILYLYPLCGKNIVEAENVFYSLDWNKIHQLAERISWEINPPTSAWLGGWWEVFIRFIDKCSERYYMMISPVCCVNLKPLLTLGLSHIYSKNQDSIPLIPSIYLQDIREIGIPDKDNIEPNHLRLRYRVTLKDVPRKYLRTEYLGH